MIKLEQNRLPYEFVEKSIFLKVKVFLRGSSKLELYQFWEKIIGYYIKFHLKIYENFIKEVKLYFILSIHNMSYTVVKTKTQYFNHKNIL